MQTATNKQPVTQCYKVTSYELITKWIDKGYTLDLSPNAIHLMTVLLRFYNADKKSVFPHQETLAERTNTSIATVKRGLNELIKANLLIKTRKKMGNVYAFTGALFELLNSSNPTVKTVQFEPSHDHEPNKEPNKTTIKKDVVVSLNSHKKSEPITLEQVPLSIRNNKAIKNKIGYWLSIPLETRQEIIAQEKEKERIKQVRIEREKADAELKAREKVNLELTWRKPLIERFSRTQAIIYVWKMRNYNVNSNGMLRDLINLYNLDVNAIKQMTEEQIEKIVP